MKRPNITYLIWTMAVSILLSSCATVEKKNKLNSTTIQKAINALPPEGGLVQLLEGEYQISVPITVGSNVILKGVAGKTILQQAPGRPGPIIRNQNGKNKVDLNIILSQLILLGNASSEKNPENARLGKTGIVLNNTNGVILRKLVFKNFASAALTILKSEQVKVVRSKIEDSGKALLMLNSSKCIINGNVIRHCSNSGITLESNCDKNLVNNNLIENIAAGSGMLLKSGDDNLIINNIIRNIGLNEAKRGTGIAVILGDNPKGKSASNRRNSLVNNIIEHTGGSGMEIVLATDTRIIQNVIKSANSNDSVKNAALLIENSTRTLAQNNLIQGNFCPGVKIDDASEISLSFNRIANNLGTPIKASGKNSKPQLNLNDGLKTKN